MGMLPIDDPDHCWRAAGRFPATHPEGRDRWHDRIRTGAPSAGAVLAHLQRDLSVPTLEDCARMSAAVNVSGPRVVGLADHAVGHLDLRRNVERGVGTDQALLDRPGHGEGLEGRAWLVARRDRAVLARVRRGLPTSLASTRGQLAIASSSPLRGSMTRAVAARGSTPGRAPPSPPPPSPGAASIVRRMSRPGLARPCLDEAHGLAHRVLHQAALAVLSAQGSSYCCSMPGQAVVVGPTEPTSWAASGPAGRSAWAPSPCRGPRSRASPPWSPRTGPSLRAR